MINFQASSCYFVLTDNAQWLIRVIYKYSFFGNTTQPTPRSVLPSARCDVWRPLGVSRGQAPCLWGCRGQVKLGWVEDRRGKGGAGEAGCVGLGRGASSSGGARFILWIVTFPRKPVKCWYYFLRMKCSNLYFIFLLFVLMGWSSWFAAADRQPPIVSR